MIEVKNLSKSYFEKLAVDNISFSIEEGEIVGLLGPNGAGKSTIMNIITGYISSSQGTVSIDGNDILEKPIAARSKIGYLPEIPPLYQDMTVKAYLDFVFDLKKVKLPKREHIEEVCKLTQISDVYDRIIKRLSKGYRQRIGVAQAILGFPPLVILDEPSVGLDPRQIIEMRNLIKKLGENHTVILSSHILSEVKAVCKRILVINKGKIIADGDPDILSSNMTDKQSNSALIEGDPELVISLIKDIDGVIEVTDNGLVEENVHNYIIDHSPDKDIRKAIFKVLSANNCIMMEMKPIEKSLEDIFVQLTDTDLLENNNESEEDLKNQDQDKDATEQNEENVENSEGDDSNESNN